MKFPFALIVWFMAVAPARADEPSPTVADALTNFSMLNVPSKGGCLVRAAAAARAPSSVKPMDPSCEAYLSRDGKTLGEKGRHIEGLVSAPHAQVLLSDAAATKAGMADNCPNFASFDKDTRKRFWVHAFASISNQESTCGADRSTQVPTAGTNGMLIGEFQISRDRQMRKWRGAHRPENERACAAEDITDFKSNSACAVDIMVDQFNGVYDRSNPGLIGNSAWQELKTNRTPSRATSSPILRNIRDFPGCR